MKKILIYASDSIARAIEANIVTIVTVAGENLKDDDLRYEVSEVKAQPKEGKARLRYRGVFPHGSTVDSIRTLIEANAAAFGSTTMKAIVYKDLAEGTLTGHLLTKKEIVERRKFTASTVEREIGFLLKGGVIASEPIVHVEAS